MNPIKISGTLEALGQHTFDEKVYKYAYLRCADASGQVVTAEDAMVLNGCNSYLAPGSRVSSTSRSSARHRPSTA